MKTIVKRFVDDLAIERMEQFREDSVQNNGRYETLRNDMGLRRKITSMGWLARFNDIISPKLLDEMIKEYGHSCGIVDLDSQERNMDKHE